MTNQNMCPVATLLAAMNSVCEKSLPCINICIITKMCPCNIHRFFQKKKNKNFIEKKKKKKKKKKEDFSNIFTQNLKTYIVGAS